MSSWSCPSLLVATAGRARSDQRSDRTGTGLLLQAPTKSLPQAWACQVDSRPVDGSLRGQPESASRYLGSDRAGELPDPTSRPFSVGTGRWIPLTKGVAVLLTRVEHWCPRLVGRRTTTSPHCEEASEWQLGPS